MITYKPKVCMDTSSTVKWFKVEHHFKEDLKANMAGKGVRTLALSEIEVIEKVIGGVGAI